MDAVDRDESRDTDLMTFVYGLLVLGGLCLCTLYNYLLFHSLAEIFSVVVAFGVFMMAWNARRFLGNGYFLFIGIAFLFIGGMDVIHTLAYKGMGVFPNDSDLTIQLWIAARYVHSVSLLAAIWFIRHRFRTSLVFATYTIVVALLFGSIFYWHVFPSCYVEGVGLTRFKINSEYVICAVMLLSIYLLFRSREQFDRNVFTLLAASITVNIASELAFTFYIGLYDFSNLVGHLLKVVAFFLMYRALIVVGLTKPYDFLFRDLKKTEEDARRERDKAQRYLDVAGSIMVAVDRDGVVTLINRKGAETLGYDESAIIGQNWFDMFVPQRVREQARSDYQRLVDGQAETRDYYENAIVTKDGEERTIAWYNTVLTDTDGAVIATLNSGEDITERKQAETQLSNYRTHLEESNRRLADSLRQIEQDEAAARRIQFHLLPSPLMTHKGYEFSRFLKPSAFLSGDFVDYFVIDDRYVGFYIADVSGHGVSSALITVLLKSMMGHIVEQYRRERNDDILAPDRVLKQINDYLVDQQLEKYVTMFYCVLDTKDRVMTFSNGGQFPRPILYDGESARFIGHKSLPPGLFREADYTSEKLNVPDAFVLALFSDGVFDVLSAQSVRAKQDVLISEVTRIDLTIDDLVERLGLNSVDMPIDDITLMLARKET
ncbi:MAG: SpoIIE family protein phosphatase [Candidatus Hydrogenedentes bacterium]|nr:SpoIIE family protein phosphatase [Candidatus Hydrogenedentota bacterium]